MTTRFPEAPIIDFDHHSEAYALGSPGIFDEFRAKCPVAYSQSYNGFWVLSRYADIADVARDPAVFSSRRDPGEGTGRHQGHVIPEIPGVAPSLPAELDPPIFHAYRKLLAPHFSPAAAVRREPMIAAVVDECIDGVVETGSADFVADIASLVTARVILDSVGLPQDDAALVARTYHEFLCTPPGTPEYEGLLVAVRDVHAMIGEAIEQRLRKPRHDLISELLYSEVEGALIDPAVVRGMIAAIIGAGADSTASFLANVFDYLDMHPETRQAVVASPETLKLACEEFLRYFTPVQVLARTASEDAELGGRCIRKGDRVALPWAAANHDPAEFPNPEELRLDRTPNRHLSFGVGIHRCLGANLAKMEFYCTVSAVLKRIGDYQIDREASKRYTSIGIVNGWVSLQATFTPGERLRIRSADFA